MKVRSKIGFLCLFLFFISFAVFAQEMAPDAGKLYNKGNSLMEQGNYSKAVEKYNAALKIEKDYRIYYQKGVALKKSGKYDKAGNAFEASAKAKPGFAAAYNALGGVDFALGNYEDAINNFKKVISTSKKESIKSKARRNIAYAYTKKASRELADANPKNAIELLTQAVTYSDYDAAYLSLAKVYSETAQYEKSLDAAQKALKYRENIGKGGPYYYMGIAYKSMGQIEKAKEMFKNARTDVTYKKLSEYELKTLD